MTIDLLIKNAFVFMTYRQVFEKKDIGIVGNSIYRVADNLDAYEEHAKVVIDRTGKYIIPGLIDCHMHVESSMTYPAAFSEAALKFGTTTVVSDPHEMANVFGMDGILEFLKQESVMDIFYAIPSSVPSTDPKIETSGAVLDVSDIEQLLDHDKVVCLGEVMNFSDLISKDDTRIKRIVNACKKHSRQLKIEGHCPKLTSEELAAFIRAGVDADHTHQNVESILEKIDAGMFMEIQSKSLNQDTVGAIVSNSLYESVALITDDIMPDDLVKGHLNTIIQKAIDYGMPFEKAIYCSTYTPARRMQLYDRGAISPGRIADLVILETRNLLKPMEVYKSGFKYKEQLVHINFPKRFYDSVKCRLAVEDDFILKTDSSATDPSATDVDVHVMQLSYDGTFTKKVIRTLQVVLGVVQWKEAGLSLAVLFERYGKNNNIGYGLIENGLISDGAIATTWSHDSHNLLVIGNDIQSMIKAQHRIIELQGGYCVVQKENIIAELPLRIGGIVADQPIVELAGQLAKVRRSIEELGYKNKNVIMSVSTLALVVSPELKLTDNGLFNVRTYEVEPLIINKVKD